MKNEYFRSIVIIFPLLVCSCELQKDSQIIIKNSFSENVVDLRLSSADYTSNSLIIDSGESVVIHPEMSTDGGISIRYVYKDKALNFPLGYITPAIPQKCIFEISEETIDGNCRQL